MENRIDGPRNTPREESERVPVPSPTWTSRRQARSPNWGKPHSSLHSPSIGNSRLLTKRARGQQVDGAIGIGPPEMPAECIVRGLARIIRKGVRTAQTREIAGVSLVLSREIPVGTFALRTADRITAYLAETGVPLIEVPCGPSAIPVVPVSNP